MKITLNRMAELLRRGETYVLTTHLSPDGDAIGSLLALAAGLKKLNKQVICLIDDDLPENFSGLLPFSDWIQKPNDTMITADFLVILDASDLERTGKVGQICKAPILNIDHHISNQGFADYLYLDGRAAATGEIIFALLQILQIPLNTEIATCLYAAIATDCGFFKYANTTPETMKTAAYLMEFKIQPHILAEEIEKRTLKSVQALTKILTGLELHENGKVALITATKDILEICEQTEGFIDLPRSIEGVDVAVLVKYKDDNHCRISMRSKETNVSEIALKFGGGGHHRAAGCTLQLSQEAAKAKILEAIRVHMRSK